MHSFRNLTSLVLLLTVSLWACGDDSPGGTVDAGDDVGGDADVNLPDQLPDTDDEPDLGVDTADDQGVDTADDQGGDTGVDVEDDTGTDVAGDTGTDTADDSGGDPDVGGDADTGADTDTGTDADTGGCVDSDGDGYGDGCDPGTDCDDDDPFSYPGAPQICDGNDNTCGDGGIPADESDGDSDDYVVCSGFVDWQGDDPTILGGDDCDDDAPAVFPGSETCIVPLLYNEDFEGDDGGWHTYGELTSWEYGTPANTFIDGANSGSFAWVTNLDGNYNDLEVSWLESPPFDFSELGGDPIVRFSHIRNIEGFDGVSLQVSTDNGLNWSLVGTSGEGQNWYNDFTANVWDGDSPGDDWVQSEHVLEGAAGSERVRFRFALMADEFDSFEGFGLDDVSLFGDITDIEVTSLSLTTEDGCLFSSESNVRVRLANLGTDDVTDLELTLSFADSEVATETVPGTLEGGQTTVYDFVATIDLTQPGTIQVTANVPDDAFPENNSASISATGGTYFEDFELSDGGWITYGDENSWSWTEPSIGSVATGFSGMNAWTTNGYTNDELSFIESPCFDLSEFENDPLFSAYIAYELESLTGETSYDELFLQVSIDGGDTWDDILRNAPGSLNWYNARDGDDGWSHESDGWVLIRSALEDTAGESDVRVRFGLDSDVSATFDGAAVDDVFLTGESITDIQVSDILFEPEGCAPGAAEEVSVTLSNLGTIDLIDLDVELSVDDAVIATETLDELLAGDSEVFDFTATLDLSAPGLHTVEVSIAPQVDEMSTANNTATLDVDTVLPLTAAEVEEGYFESFETGAGGFIASEDGLWELGAPSDGLISDADDGINAWVTNLTGDYPDDADSYLDFRCMDFGDLDRDPLLSFSIIYGTEEGFDGAWIEVSTDGGETFETLLDDGTAQNWYNDLDDIEWNGDSGGWLQARARLTDTAGEPNVLVRLHFDSDGSNVIGDLFEGVGFDAVSLVNDLTDDLAVVSINLDTTDRCGLGSSEVVTAKIINNGPAPIDGFDLNLAVGSQSIDVRYDATIQPGLSALYVFDEDEGADLSVPGDYSITVTVSTPTDETPSNDSMSIGVNSVAHTSTGYAESFEDSADGWITYGGNSSWQRGEPAGLVIDGGAGDSDWAFVTNPAGPHNDGELSYAELPCFDLSTATTPQLAFQRANDLESCCDGVTMEYSLDRGISWALLLPESGGSGWYDDASGWTGQSDGYVLTGLDLPPALLVNDLRLRFVLQADDTVSLEGISIDNIQLLEIAD